MRSAPLGRLNAAEGMATLRAQEEYEKFFATLGRPAHQTLAFHWARGIEALYAAERLVELAQDPEITSPEVRTIPTGIAGVGISAIAAPRGSLIHHYEADENGLVTKLNLIVATAFNHGAMCMSIKKAAKALVKGFEVDEGKLNMVEMAFRAYDPCFSCATHFVGETPMEVDIYSADGELFKKVTRGI